MTNKIIVIFLIILFSLPSNISNSTRELTIKDLNFVQQVVDHNKEIAELLFFVCKTSESLDIDPLLSISLIKVESNWNQYAVSYKNALGYTQLLLSTANDYLPVTKNQLLNNPKLNIKIGLTHFKWLCDYFNDNTISAIVAYNMGHYRTRKYKLRGYNLQNFYYYRKIRSTMDNLYVTIEKDGSPLCQILAN